MTYDFDTLIDRRGTGSLKWDEYNAELPMWVADMDFATAPEIREALQRELDRGVFGYAIETAQWRRVIADWWEHRHGFRFDEEWLVFSTGVVPAISSIVRKLTTPAENVLVMTPVYDIFFNSILNNGRNPIECPLVYDETTMRYSIDFADLERKLANPQTSLMLLCNPHNPIGIVWDADTLARIGELAWKHHVIVVSDEIHCDLTMPGVEYTPFASVSAHCRDNSVTCVAPTKTFNLAGLHSAAVVVPNPTLRHRVWRGINTDEVGEPGAFAIPATVAAFTQGEPWLEELRAYLAENRRVVTDYLHDPANWPALPEGTGVRVVPGDATYLLWLDCSNVLNAAGKQDTEDLGDYLQRTTGLLLTAGGQYHGDGARFVRLNVACPLERVYDALDRFLRGVNAYVADKQRD